MPNYYPLINARFNERRADANLHAFDIVAIIGDILSSHDKNQIHVHNHARVHTVSCDHGAYSRNGSPYSNKIHSFFSVISSWRLLNQENAHARVCDMENFYAMPMHLFFNHWIRVWAGAYHKCHQRRLRRVCAFVQSRQGLAAH